MPAASTEGQPVALSLAEKAVCKVVYGAPRPRPLLLPVGLELWLYVQKMRNLQRKRMEASCLELALEGERLCKAGDFKAGAAFFEAAVQVGTEDLKTLSAIYSQLGNAYFYLKEYARALEYHRHDLLLARTIGDRMGEAKASGNLGNTLKVLGRFDEAVVCCQRHLDIAQEQGDKVGEARALYNIGNVYHAKGKQLSWTATQDPGHLPPDVREPLRRASEFYERNLSLVKELGDRAAQGRAYGNLGNTHYLLGSFMEATAFHKERLAIAKEFGDKAAERRAYSNLGNAHIFLGRFDVAAEYYKKTLQLSRQLKDQAVEAQACYSLGNTYTLLQDYERAAEYHLRHLLIAQELADRVGEGRACWSLGNAYVSMGSPAQALTFAKKHLEISQEIGDRNGELTARMNVAQLQLVLGRLTSPAATEKPDLAGYEAQGARPKRTQRLSAETWGLLRLPLEREQNGDSHQVGEWRGPGRDVLPLPMRSRKYQEGLEAAERPREGSHSPLDSADVRVQVPRTSIPRAPSSDEECFFDLLSKFQSSRMDDQRCPLEEGQPGAAEATAAPTPEERVAQPSLTASPQTEELLDLIASSQGRRLDDQRASVGSLPGLRVTHSNLGRLRGDGDPQEPGDEFFNMLIKCQSSRIDDQRCPPPDVLPRGPTMPDEDFFSLIQRVQAKRMDEQRVDLAGSPEQEVGGSPEPRQPCQSGAS
ncbi:G-protein-signaling modulator 1 isoform X9 [Mirounga angustirostris]|uniref:G-protein-signaling modulator 1 n=4 Tax=Pinnipedia TaxID=3072905 RepID=A0A8M1MYE4_NEOSC|nr:G-protein-signaling modulator 1 isoform X4 [Mirounga leonina]XP_044776239.1 G-protein-signaling modulator 1 isoform X1 [Neomonachus schauinslandi]XP_045739463.1 G-protein-signaling modulator 1 isoform X5 [Mirounga angustirostris]